MNKKVLRPKRLKSTAVGFVFCVSVVIAVRGSVDAQTTVYTDEYGNPTVTVDLRVLDRRLQIADE